MSDAEQREIYERAAEIVFGADWRNGNLRSRYFTESAVGRRNESVIFKRLLADAIEMADLESLRIIATNASLHYSRRSRFDRQRA